MKQHLRQFSSQLQRNALVMAAALGGSACGVTQAAALVGLGSLPHGVGIPMTVGTAISADGSVVVGYDNAAFREGFRWTSETGIVGLGLFGGQTIPYGVSADGSVIVGGGGTSGIRWTAATGWHTPPLAPQAITPDGSLVVGYYNDNGFLRPGTWTVAGGLEPLTGFAPLSYGYAYGVSADGSVIVGNGVVDGETTGGGFRWTESDGPLSLGGGTEARAVSSDGQVTVGQWFSTQSFALVAFRWTLADGFLEASRSAIGGSDALAVSGDGGVVVGRSGVGAFVWEEGSEPRSLWNVLLDYGLNPAESGWTALTEATGISADGRYIVGTGIHNGFPEAFRADLGSSAQVPESSTWFAGLALVVLAGWRRRGKRTQLERNAAH